MQAEEIHLAHPQQSWIGGTVRCVAAAAAFSFHGHVFEDKGPLLVCMALEANRVSAGQGSHLSKRRRAVSIVAVAALDEPLVYTVVIRSGEVSLHGDVTSVAEFWLFPNKQILRLFGIVRGMAIETTNIVAGMY